MEADKAERREICLWLVAWQLDQWHPATPDWCGPALGLCQLSSGAWNLGLG